MFSVKQKRKISEQIQKILRDTKHPELPKDEIQFQIHIYGDLNWSWADITNNGACTNPGIIAKKQDISVGCYIRHCIAKYRRKSKK